MYGFILVLHIIASTSLILIVLLQAGKGSGISGLFGGGGNEAVFGGNTTPVILKKITATMAIVFMITSLFLTVLGSRTRTRSLAENIPPAPAKQQPSPASNVPSAPSVPTPP